MKVGCWFVDKNGIKSGIPRKKALALREKLQKLMRNWFFEFFAWILVFRPSVLKNLSTVVSSPTNKLSRHVILVLYTPLFGSEPTLAWLFELLKGRWSRLYQKSRFYLFCCTLWHLSGLCLVPCVINILHAFSIAKNMHTLLCHLCPYLKS